MATRNLRRALLGPEEAKDLCPALTRAFLLTPPPSLFLSRYTRARALTLAKTHVVGGGHIHLVVLAFLDALVRGGPARGLEIRERGKK